MVRKITWDKAALQNFREAIAYIKKDSIQNAEKVKTDILDKVSALSQTPEIYPPDKYKLNNNKTYRAFELHRLRISYMVKDHEIIIARVRHTSQSPQPY